MKITSVNKQYYLDLRYIIPTYIVNNKEKVKRGTTIFVNIKDLPKKSEIKISVKCDHCNEIIEKMFCNYLRDKEKHNQEDVCISCAYKKMGKRYRKNGNDIINEFYKKDMIPLFKIKEYESCKDKLAYLCKKHINKGILYISYDSFKNQDAGCKYCSYDNFKGENNPNWNGGTTSENATIRQSAEYKVWRNSVFYRDKYTCKACGDSKGGNLNAHHIKNFAEYPDLRFDVDNGVTLCDSCHNFNKTGSFHNVYGAKNNTAEQLEEFIKNKK